MTYFNRKLMKRDIPASATVEGALVIPVILYAVADAGMSLFINFRLKYVIDCSPLFVIIPASNRYLEAYAAKPY